MLVSAVVHAPGSESVYHLEFQELKKALLVRQVVA